MQTISNFTDWLRANGYSAISQEAINKAIAQGEPSRSMAIQAVNKSGGKFTIPQTKPGMANGGPVDKWIQKAVSPKDEGKFTQWCKDHGFSGVTQEAINAAIKEGGHAAKMANFAVNVSGGKYRYPGKAEGGIVEDMNITPEVAPQEGEEPKPEDMKGEFSIYEDQGVDPELIKVGNELYGKIQDVAENPDPMAVDNFTQEVKDFVAKIDSAMQDARRTGDPELMRALKEMGKEARDLQSSIESIISDYAMGGNNQERNIE